MKKRKALFVTCIVIAAIGGIIAATRHSDSLDELSRYAKADKMLYFDLFPGSGYVTTPKMSAQQISVHKMQLRGVDFKTVSDFVHKSLREKDGWHYSLARTPFFGMPTNQSIYATRGSVAGQPEDTIEILPESYDTSELDKNKIITGAPPAIGFSLVKMHTMSKYEVWWLKLTHYGKDPFTPPTDLPWP